MKAKTIISKPKFTTGFTIIEILVVIAIIGILTVIIFPAINEIRAKNRDAEKISDISTIQLALSLYYNQQGTYPLLLDDLTPKYLPADALVSPNTDPYVYVPLRGLNGTKCTYYHLGVKVELPSAQVDPSDLVISGDFEPVPPDTRSLLTNDRYSYCGEYPGPGINGANPLIYDVRP